MIFARIVFSRFLHDFRCCLLRVLDPWRLLLISCRHHIQIGFKQQSMGDLNREVCLYLLGRVSYGLVKEIKPRKNRKIRVHRLAVSHCFVAFTHDYCSVFTHFQMPSTIHFQSNANSVAKIINNLGSSQFLGFLKKSRFVRVQCVYGLQISLL